MSVPWVRVCKSKPCPICGKFDWCLLGQKGAICMRVQVGKEFKNGGWFHPYDTSFKAPTPKREPERPSINTTALMRRWTERTKPEWITKLSDLLGVKSIGLMAIGCAWAAEHKAWAFPMKDGYGSPCGVRLRAMNGQKWAVKGSRDGIFLPEITPGSLVFVCEGPTDTAAAISIGIQAVGRSSCGTGLNQIQTVFRRLHVERAVVLLDNDGPGVLGGKRFCDHINVPTCTWVPPCKDLREFVKSGGTKELIEAMLKGFVWQQPKP